MPIYEYACSACDHRVDILLGLNDPGPHFCPSCGEEGTMRKLFAPPTIHFKGSGWAKKDRGAASASRSSASKADGSGGDGASAGGAGSTASQEKTSTTPSSGSSSETSSPSSDGGTGSSKPATSGPGSD
jgi:putative FmdB family regulatory protein